MNLFGEPRMRRRRAKGRRPWLAVVVVITLATIALVATVSFAFSCDMDGARASTLGRSRVVASPWGPIEFADVGSGPPSGHLWIGQDAELWATIGAFIEDLEPA